MKPFKRLFKKKQTTVRGITEEEYISIYNAVNCAYNEAVLRQKPGTTRPSGYMKGLRAALDILDSIDPHNMEVA